MSSDASNGTDMVHVPDGSGDIVTIPNRNAMTNPNEITKVNLPNIAGTRKPVYFENIKMMPDVPSRKPSDAHRASDVVLAIDKTGFLSIMNKVTGAPVFISDPFMVVAPHVCRGPPYGYHRESTEKYAKSDYDAPSLYEKWWEVRYSLVRDTSAWSHRKTANGEDPDAAAFIAWMDAFCDFVRWTLFPFNDASALRCGIRDKVLDKHGPVIEVLRLAAGGDELKYFRDTRKQNLVTWDSIGKSKSSKASSSSSSSVQPVPDATTTTAVVTGQSHKLFWVKPYVFSKLTEFEKRSLPKLDSYKTPPRDPKEAAYRRGYRYYQLPAYQPGSGRRIPQERVASLFTQRYVCRFEYGFILTEDKGLIKLTPGSRHVNITPYTMLPPEEYVHPASVTYPGAEDFPEEGLMVSWDHLKTPMALQLASDVATQMERKCVANFEVHEKEQADKRAQRGVTTKARPAIEDRLMDVYSDAFLNSGRVVRAVPLLTGTKGRPAITHVQSSANQKQNGVRDEKHIDDMDTVLSNADPTLTDAPAVAKASTPSQSQAVPVKNDQPVYKCAKCGDAIPDGTGGFNGMDRLCEAHMKAQMLNWKVQKDNEDTVKKHNAVIASTPVVVQSPAQLSGPRTRKRRNPADDDVDEIRPLSNMNEEMKVAEQISIEDNAKRHKAETAPVPISANVAAPTEDDSGF